MSDPNAPAISRRMVRRAPVESAALVVGAVFLLLGVLGFIPGVTTNYDAMDWVGHHSGAELLDLFNVSVLHNVIHLALGIAGLLMGRGFNGARLFLIGGGVINAALWAYGLAIDRHSGANFVPVNSSDNWLHLGLAVAMLFLGLAFGRARPGSRPQGSWSTGVSVDKG